MADVTPSISRDTVTARTAALLVTGLLASAAITFMLAAPVLNPVVIASTFVAYHGRTALWTMVLGRFGLGLIVAIVAGWVLGGRRKDELLRRSEHHDQAHEHLELEAP